MLDVLEMCKHGEKCIALIILSLFLIDNKFMDRCEPSYCIYRAKRFLSVLNVFNFFDNRA